MASTLIHMVVGQKIGDKINKKSDLYKIGVIAPDLSKIIGESRKISHFIDTDEGEPNINRFLNKYGKHLKDDFVLGYYVHIYTDYLWTKYFIPEILDKGRNMIKTLDGKEQCLEPDVINGYIYSDYTTLNKELINRYHIDLSILYFHSDIDRIIE